MQESAVVGVIVLSLASTLDSTFHRPALAHAFMISCVVFEPGDDMLYAVWSPVASALSGCAVLQYTIEVAVASNGTVVALSNVSTYTNASFRVAKGAAYEVRVNQCVHDQNNVRSRVAAVAGTFGGEMVALSLSLPLSLSLSLSLLLLLLLLPTTADNNDDNCRYPQCHVAAWNVIGVSEWSAWSGALLTCACSPCTVS